MKHKRNDPICHPWDSQGNEKMQFLFVLLLALTFLSEMKIKFQRNAKQKSFEIIERLRNENEDKTETHE